MRKAPYLLVLACGAVLHSGCADGGGEEDAEPDVGVTAFPEGTYHYAAAWIGLGVESAAFDTAFVTNITVSGDEVTLEHQDCSEAHPPSSYRLEPVDDAFEVVSASGAPVEFLGAPRNRFRLRVVDACEIEFTVDDGASDFSDKLAAGRVCVTDWCDDLDPSTDRILVDYCDGEPRIECEAEAPE